MAKRKTQVSDIDKVVMEELDAFAGACITDLQEAAEDAANWAKKNLPILNTEILLPLQVQRCSKEVQVHFGFLSGNIFKMR